MSLIPILSIATGGALFLILLLFSIVSLQEEEPRAFRRALILALLLPVPYITAGLIEFTWQIPICLVLLGAPFLALVISLLPIGNTLPPGDDAPKKRIDERDIMFSRNELKKGTARYDEYYRHHPEKALLDDAFRRHPGLLKKGALYHDAITASAARASFKTVAAFHGLLENEKLSTPPHEVEPAQITPYIIQWAKKLGAVSAGVTRLHDYHLYSTVGRGERYGEPVAIDHQFAIALTVEMDKSQLDRAPHGPIVMESAQQYLNAGAIAVQIAEFIRQLGYSTLAHIDKNYRVVCPLVARDAGLGEIGRMGLLMTPELGPRVRIAVVTTALPLIPAPRKRDPTVIDFCRQCQKCAVACPSRAISFADREEIDGALRWQINSEACFTYWCAAGTDCGRCMSVCPYSHPDNALHNVIRFAVKRSALCRYLALKLDDFFYGCKPPPLPSPDWIPNAAQDAGNHS